MTDLLNYYDAPMCRQDSTTIAEYAQDVASAVMAAKQAIAELEERVALLTRTIGTLDLGPLHKAPCTALVITPKPEPKPLTVEKCVEIKTMRLEYPAWQQQDIADRVDINSGRVSEVLRGEFDDFIMRSDRPDLMGRYNSHAHTFMRDDEYNETLKVALAKKRRNLG